jgi:hypothetical protein
MDANRLVVDQGDRKHDRPIPEYRQKFNKHGSPFELPRIRKSFYRLGATAACGLGAKRLRSRSACLRNRAQVLGSTGNGVT